MLIVIAGMLILFLVIFLIAQNFDDEKKLDEDIDKKDEHPLQPSKKERL